MALQEVDRSITILPGISMSHGEHKLQVMAKQFSGDCCLRSIGMPVLHSFPKDSVL